VSVACAQTKKADFRRACLENALRPYYGIQNQRPGARGVNQQQQALHRETPQMRSCSPLTGKPEVILKSRLQPEALLEPDCGQLLLAPRGWSPNRQ